MISPVYLSFQRDGFNRMWCSETAGVVVGWEKSPLYSLFSHLLASEMYKQSMVPGRDG